MAGTPSDADSRDRWLADPTICDLLPPDALFLEIFQRAGVERDRGTLLHLVVERKTLGFLVYGDDIGLLLHQRLDDGIGVVVAHLVAGDDQVPDFGYGIVLVGARIRA